MTVEVVTLDDIDAARKAIEREFGPSARLEPGPQDGWEVVVRIGRGATPAAAVEDALSE